MWGYNREEDHLATIPEAIREWLWNVGYYPRFKDCQYILSDYDTWETNPHYCGPEQQHPEDDTPSEVWMARYYFSDGTPVAIYDNIGRR